MISIKNIKSWAAIVIIYFAFISVSFSQQMGSKPGLNRMSRPELMPFFYAAGTETRQFQSQDLTGKNGDGSFVHAYTMYIDSNREHVIFDEFGPGCLYRQQMNIWNTYINNKVIYIPHTGESVIKYYFDDEKTARINLKMDDFFGMKHSPFDWPFDLMDTIKKAGFSEMFYPFVFRKRLRVTVTPSFDWTDRGTTWYQYSFISFSQDYKVETWKGKTDDLRDYSIVRNQWTHLGEDPKQLPGTQIIRNTISIPPGDTRKIFERTGQGSIQSIRIKLHPFNAETFYQNRLKIYWDDNPVPAVDLPLSYLFGSGGGSFPISKDNMQRTMKNLLYGFDAGTSSFYCYWPMPFWKRARMEITNNCKSVIDSLEVQIGYATKETINYPYGMTGLFHASAKKDSLINNKSPFGIAFTEHGHGQLVGINFNSWNYDFDGDQSIYLDDSHTSRIHGNGTEDDHGQGWGGEGYREALFGAILNGCEGAYRTYLGEPIIFNKNIQINYEFSKENTALNDSSRIDVTVFYYKSPLNDSLALTDSIDIGNTIDEKAHDYKIAGETWHGTTDSHYDGFERSLSFFPVSDDGRSYNGNSEFSVAITGKNDGVRIRKRMNRTGNGIQKARVYVDGRVLEKPWYIVTPSGAPASNSWFDSEYEIPSSYTKNKNRIRVRIEYLNAPDKVELNEYFYWVYSYPLK